MELRRDSGRWPAGWLLVELLALLAEAGWLLVELLALLAEERSRVMSSLLGARLKTDIQPSDCGDERRPTTGQAACRSIAV